MNSFASAISSAMATVAAVAGVTVTYWRGEDSTAPLTATPGSSQVNTADASDMPIQATSRDWIFKASELVIDGVRILPQRGDQVRETVGAVTTVYEVLTDGNQVYRYCDRAHTRIRVHTLEAAA